MGEAEPKLFLLGEVSSNRDNFEACRDFNGCMVIRNGKVREIRLEIDGGLFVMQKIEKEVI